MTKMVDARGLACPQPVIMTRKALQENDWNQSKAARSLGISRDNLRYRVKKYDIKRE